MSQCIPGEPFEKVLADERTIITRQRENRHRAPHPHKGTDEDRVKELVHREQTSGLALSGGGIRSASFALGVMQGLYKHHVIKHLDYLSTVSGGGYIGASLTWFNHLRTKTERDAPWDFPFREYRHGARRPVCGAAQDTDEHANRPLDFLRHHGRYLIPGAGINTLSFVAMLLRSVLLSVFTYFGLLVVVMTALHHAGLFETASFAAPVSNIGVLTIIFLCGWLLAGVVAGTSAFWFESSRFEGYRQRVLTQRVMGGLLTLTIFGAAVATLPPLATALDGLLRSLPPLLGARGAAYLLVLHRRSPQATLGTGFKTWITAVLLIYGALFSAYLAGNYFSANMAQAETRICFLVLFACAAGTGLFIDTNLSGIGRMYRDRLMETFLPNPQAVRGNEWQPAELADKACFVNVNGEKEYGPYHLVNTNVVLPDSTEAKFSGRGGDNFVVSHKYCGGDAIGWYPTAQVMGGELTLATAIAISGAAINPHTGAGGRGITRNKLVSSMMEFFNIRLGVWIENPREAELNAGGGMLALRWPLPWPSFANPGLKQGLFGQGRNEQARFIELTDGGHFDNTGLYELIRRRVKVIILSRAGTDERFTLDDVAVAIERARVDFGVYIRFDFDGNPHTLDKLIPGSGEARGFGLKFPLSAQGFAVARIEYPMAGKADSYEEGRLYLVNAVLTPDLPLDIYSYKSDYAGFPNETTTDQFFDERQFEAYRELGYQLADALCGKTDLLKRCDAWQAKPAPVVEVLAEQRRSA